MLRWFRSGRAPEGRPRARPRHLRLNSHNGGAVRLIPRGAPSDHRCLRYGNTSAVGLGPEADNSAAAGKSTRDAREVVFADCERVVEWRCPLFQVRTPLPGFCRLA